MMRRFQASSIESSHSNYDSGIFDVYLEEDNVDYKTVLPVEVSSCQQGVCQTFWQPIKTFSFMLGFS